jgi:hypothetical protein
VTLLTDPVPYPCPTPTEKLKMRLIEAKENDALCFTEDLRRDIPPYAILSHTWGTPADEVSYHDFKQSKWEHKEAAFKLKFCAKQARKHKLNHFWADTTNIDKVERDHCIPRFN